MSEIHERSIMCVDAPCACGHPARDHFSQVRQCSHPDCPCTEPRAVLMPPPPLLLEADEAARLSAVASILGAIRESQWSTSWAIDAAALAWVLAMGLTSDVRKRWERLARTAPLVYLDRLSVPMEER